MSAGKFISLEGGEGVGKSTQARLLAARLRERGIDVEETREPGGSPGAEEIRRLLLDPAQSWGSRAEALLFAAARADHVEKVIRPALDAGRWVLCDRFVHSSLAYQGGALGLGFEAIDALHAFGSDGLLPDQVILLRAGAEVAAERLRARDGDRADRIGGRDEAFHARVRDGFVALAARDPDRIATVDATGTPEAVAARVWEQVGPLL